MQRQLSLPHESLLTWAWAFFSFWRSLLKQELIELIPRAHAHFRLGRGTKVELWKMTAIAVLNIKQHKTHYIRESDKNEAQIVLQMSVET